MTVLDFDICHCDCHTTEKVHIINCCDKCPVCKQLIKRGYLEAHLNNCNPKWISNPYNKKEDINGKN